MPSDDTDTLDARLLEAAAERLAARREVSTAEQVLRDATEAHRLATNRLTAAITRYDDIEDRIARNVGPRPKLTETDK